MRINEPNSVERDDPDLPQVRTHGRGTPAGSRSPGRRCGRRCRASDGRATSNCRTRVRPMRAASSSWESPRHRTSWAFPWLLISSIPPRPSRRGHAGLGPQPDRVMAVGRLDLVERAVEDLAAAEDHEDPVAQSLGDRHVVRGEDHGRPGLPQVEHRILDDLGIDRVQPGERLVEDQQLGAVEHARDELDLLGHPLGERLDLLVDPGEQAHPIQPFVDAAVELGLPRALERPVVAEQPPHGHPLIKAALLGQVADAVVRRAGAALAQDLDLAAIGQEDVHDHPQRRRLARAVGTDEPVERPARHREIQLVHRDHAAELLGHALDGDGIAHDFPGPLDIQ